MPVEGLERLQRKLINLPPRVKAEFVKEQKAIVSDIVRYAKRNHPYKDITGTATRSIRWEFEKPLTAMVLAGGKGTGCDYFISLEFGTHRSRPFPTLFPAYYVYYPEILSRLDRAISEGVRNA